MRWKKLGRIFCADGQHPWMASHASYPVAHSLEPGLVRVYFSCRDGRKRSHIASLVFDPDRPAEILELSSTPMLAPGPADAFDGSGTSMGCLVRRESDVWLYYVGWKTAEDGTWRNAIGLAVSRDGGARFSKHSPAPVLESKPSEPPSAIYPWVNREGDRWRMWHGSKIVASGSAPETWIVTEAASSDGVAWERAERTCIAPRHPEEFAVVRPCVVKDSDGYRMWYCRRGEFYRLGCADSPDGRHWTRRDGEAGLDVSKSGWDSESIAYPCVFDHRGRRYMVYNGNGYGQTGFGLAVAESAS